MRLRAKTFRIRARLPRAVGDAQRAWTAREGVAVVITDGHLEAMAEAAPLPGLSTDTIESVERALGEIAWAELSLEGDDPLSIAAHAVDAAIPSARFAVEAALLDLVGRAGGSSVATLLADGAPAAEVCSAALLDDLERALPRARAAIADGACALKVKIGRPGQAREEAVLLRALRSELGDEVRIRADANGSLESAADPLLGVLASIGAEMVEDPFPTLDAVLASALPIPVALDGLLAADPPRALAAIARRRATFAVLKPSVIGGLGRALALAEAARARGGRAIVSHAYDPPRAFAACAHLALALGGDEVHGLALYPGIDAWTTLEGLSIPVPEMLRPYRVGSPDGGGLG